MSFNESGALGLIQEPFDGSPAPSSTRTSRESTLFSSHKSLSSVETTLEPKANSDAPSASEAESKLAHDELSETLSELASPSTSHWWENLQRAPKLHRPALK